MLHMETVLNIVASFFLAVTGAGGGDAVATAQTPESVEVGIAEVSPAGEAGGYAMPASGCSEEDWHGEGLHDCNQQPEIELDDPIVRIGEETTLRWDPNGIDRCVLVGNLENEGPVNGPGSEVIAPFADTTFVIICDNNAGYTDTVTIRVLPRIQET